MNFASEEGIPASKPTVISLPDHTLPRWLTLLSQAPSLTVTLLFSAASVRHTQTQFRDS